MWSFHYVREVISVGTVTTIVGIVFIAAALQRAIGFGFALLAVPLMAFVVPTKSAVLIVFLTATVTCAWVALDLRRQIEWPTTRRLGLGAIIGAPIGVMIISAVSGDTLRLILGVTTCIAAIWIVVSSRLMRSELVVPHRFTTVSVGFASGVLNTSLATSR